MIQDYGRHEFLIICTIIICWNEESHEPEITEKTQCQNSTAHNARCPKFYIAICIKATAYRLEIQAMVFPVLYQHAASGKCCRERQKGAKWVVFHHKAIVLMDPGAMMVQYVIPSEGTFPQQINSQADQNR